MIAKNPVLIKHFSLILFTIASSNGIKSFDGKKSHMKFHQSDTIILISPWNHFQTGYRFKRDPQGDTDTDYAILLLEPNNKREYRLIPREKAELKIDQL